MRYCKKRGEVKWGAYGTMDCRVVRLVLNLCSPESEFEEATDFEATAIVHPVWARKTNKNEGWKLDLRVAPA